MKLSVFSVLYKDKPLADVLDILSSKGIAHVEVGAGGFIGKDHCDPSALLKDKKARTAFTDLFKSRNMHISCLSCHGNPLHPQKHLAQMYNADIQNAIDLASLLKVPRIVTFSGCPGDSDDAKYPNWPVSPFPEDFQVLSQWQWDKKLIPYWTDMGKYAEDKGVKIAMEMHGGYSVHSPYTAIRMRKATGSKAIGANLDPSHMWWQGIDPSQAARYLGQEDCLYYFHAKDAMIDKNYVSYYGVTDMQSFSQTYGRGWQFRTVGFGHSLKEWADIMSALRAAGYDDVVSIEHEDGYMSVDEGLTKAIDNLNRVVMTQPASSPKAFSPDDRFI
ncbi:MAG: sugar phosphate isomerase/epimerase [Clostridia bacterium]|jgi:sugar phosphate isomerase/epimerase|nr:sugar phosphate isomerase/epimerase [Clostridia bacterium]MBT7122927.1 sugar phosphate isomerase/epimerase [Clostridia bacterium]